MKRNDGFTLVELLVTMAAAAVVTIAAASLILLGVRIQHASTADAAEQQNVRIVLTMLEKMAGNGEISSVENTYSGWMLKGESQPLFTYDANSQTLYSGEGTTGSILLEGLNGAGARMDGKVLRFTFDTVRGGHYETAIYCRAGVSASPNVTAGHSASSESPRYQFLETLINEYGDGSNIGIDTEEGRYYAQWYSQEKMGITWPEDTPWCACFLTWAAVKSEAITRGSDYFFAEVDIGIAAFKADDSSANNSWKDADEIPEVGDYVFFDWSGGNDPDHVGVVLNADENFIYTIEGNSGGVIAVRQYPINSSVIIGYGTLPAFVQSEPAPTP